MLWWGSRPRRPRDAAWLALAPVGIAAYAAWLGLVEGTRCASTSRRRRATWQCRLPAGARTGSWPCGRRAPAGLGSRTPVYFEEAAGDPFRIAAINVMLFVTLVFAVFACVGVWRRLRARTGLGGDVAAAAAPFPSRHSR